MFRVFKNTSINDVFGRWALEAWKPEFYWVFFKTTLETWNWIRKLKTSLFYQTLFGNGKSNWKLWPWKTEFLTLRNGNGVTKMTLKMEKIAKIVLKTLWLRKHLIDSLLNFAPEYTHSSNTLQAVLGIWSGRSISRISKP